MIRSPVILIGCPRAGTTLLFNILSEVPSLWSIGYESKAIIERYHHPREKNWESGELESDDLTPVSRTYMLVEFQRQAAPGTFWRKINRFRASLRGNYLWKSLKRRGRDKGMGSGISSAVPQSGLQVVRKLVKLRNSILPLPKKPIRLLEKTPENCLRLPFLQALFPDVRIIYLVRDGRANVSSLMEGWRQPHLFPGYRVPEPVRIPGDERGRWAFTLIPGWRDLLESPLEEVCAWQWVRCNEAVLDHRERTEGQVPYLTLRYENMIADPHAFFSQVATFIGVEFQPNFGHLSEGLPLINVVSPPESQKWRRENPKPIARVQGIIEPMMEKLGYPSYGDGD